LTDLPMAERLEQIEQAEAFEIPATSLPARVITVRAGEMPRMATEGENALIEAGSPIYSRGGALVRPIVEEVEAAKGRKTKVARLVPVSSTTLCDHLARVAHWVRFNARKKTDVTTDVPSEVAATILARDGEWQLSRLAGVITTPTLRRDGTILSEAGYDPATKLLLMGPPALPPIPEKPTKQDAAKALAFLDDLLAEFPFVDGGSRAVALSALITPVIRGAMSVAPLHAISAPVPGSGKSYIIDLAAVISTGDRAPVIAAGRNEEETEKRLVSALLGAQPIVSIDNVNGELGGDMLCQMIERPLVDVRILGQSKLVRIESRATTFATGNNIRLVGDMTRRVVLCSLDPDMERPELRQFKGDPVSQVLADRGRYIAAALTVVRAYVAAGYPDMLPALASFEDWSRLVRSALVWLGCTDPLETMNKARSDDPITSSLGALFRQWYDAADGRARTVGQLKELAAEKDPFGNALRPDFLEVLHTIAEGRAGDVNSTKLGKFLGSYQGRIVDNLKLVGTDDGHAKQKLWKVMRHS
jgi:putative DNA primase/helicase